MFFTFVGQPGYAGMNEYGVANFIFCDGAGPPICWEIVVKVALAELSSV